MLQLVAPLILAPLVLWLLIRDRRTQMSETTKVLFILLGFVFALYAAWTIWFYVGYDF
jgi:formate hydrogenlyase subunit 3/multisubunit Na+/H+ antiporter MnhD subunit